MCQLWLVMSCAQPASPLRSTLASKLHGTGEWADTNSNTTMYIAITNLDTSLVNTSWSVKSLDIEALILSKPKVKQNIDRICNWISSAQVGRETEMLSTASNFLFCHCQVASRCQQQSKLMRSK